MTVAQARKILGSISDQMTDEEIQKDIETATLFKELFFEIISSKTENKLLWHNGLDVNKTTSSNLH